MNNAQAIHSFWSSFGLPAYDVNTVPDDAAMPYITYEVMESDYFSRIALSASLWYKDTSWSAITTKAEIIKSYLGIGGKVITTDDGALWITRGTPFAQRMSEPSSELVRRITLNINIDYNTVD